MDMQCPKRAYAINEATRITGLGKTSLYLAIAKGDLIARKFRRRTIILDRDLQRFLDRLKEVAR